MTDKEKFIALVDDDKLKKSDAIILLEGDGFFRCGQAAKLYKESWAKIIVVSGGITDRGYGSYPAKELAPELVKLGVKKTDLIAEEASMNTREQAVNIMRLTKEKKWEKIILVASPYHQYRAFLTFLKAMREVKMKIQIINSPAQNLPWFEKNKWGRRFDLLEQEFAKIDLYRKKNHLASFSEAIDYQKWKEKQK